MKFRASAGTTSISKESDVYAVVDGVVDLPLSLGQELGLEAVADGEPKGKKAEKAEKPDGEPKGKK